MPKLGIIENPAAHLDRHRVQALRHVRSVGEDTITVTSSNHSSEFSGVQVVQAGFHLSIEEAQKLYDDLGYLLAEQPQDDPGEEIAPAADAPSEDG